MRTRCSRLHCVQKNDEVIRLREQLRIQENLSSQKVFDAPFKEKVTQSQIGKIFVKVIFEKDATKSYSYLIGDFKVKVGDFVVVPISDKTSGQTKIKSAQIIYISSPGETSPYAKSEIIRKADYDEW